MKRAGIVIILIGLVITLVTGIKFVTKEKVVDMGELQISRNKKHSIAWSPIAGIVVMAIGGGILLLGFRKQ